MKELSGFEKVTHDIEVLAKNSSMSRIAFSIALSRLFEKLTNSEEEKAFRYLFISDKVWKRCRELYMFDTLNPSPMNPYYAYIMGPGQTWFAEKYDRTCMLDTYHCEHMWKIYQSAKKEKSSQIKRVTVIYRIMDEIGKIDRLDFYEFGLDAETALLESIKSLSVLSVLQ